MMSMKNKLMTLGLGVVVSGCCLMLMFSGCAAFGGAGYQEQEQTYRKEFQTTRSRKSMRWLLANRVQQGMSQKTVNEVMGQEGERELADSWLKNGSPSFRTGDDTFRYGPDDEGRSIYLMFRGDKLVNYSASEFE